MTQIADRRYKSGNQETSHQRFLDRYKGYTKKAIQDSIAKGNVTDIGRNGVDVVIPQGDLREPSFHHGPGGFNRHVLPGNKKYSTGDREPKDDDGRGGGSGGGDEGEGGENGKGAGQGEGEDSFVFHLSEEEFLNYLYDDLRLPNLTKESEGATKTKWQRNGFTSNGQPNRLDIVRSKQKRIGRLLAAAAPYNDEIIKLLTEERDILKGRDENSALPNKPIYRLRSQWQSKAEQIQNLNIEIKALKDTNWKTLLPIQQARIEQIDKDVLVLEAKINHIPRWNEDTDLRYRQNERKPAPHAKAVMFCLMDVSGSMGEDEKNKAKIFFYLLYRFLQRQYEQTDIVFIRHHEKADEVKEKEFFYGTASGGTIVSSALIEMKKIIAERYQGEEWNIYGAQASDGDNTQKDNPDCASLMANELLPKVQGFFYTEILGASSPHQNLWDTYEAVAKDHPDKLWLGTVREIADIWPLFREFMKNQDFADTSPRMAAFATPRFG